MVRAGEERLQIDRRAPGLGSLVSGDEAVKLIPCVKRSLLAHASPCARSSDAAPSMGSHTKKGPGRASGPGLAPPEVRDSAWRSLRGRLTTRTSGRGAQHPSCFLLPLPGEGVTE